MLEVGFSDTCAMRSWPEEIPPSTPPALFPNQPLGLLDACRVRAEERVLIRERRVDRLQRQRSYLAEIAVNAHAQPLGEILASDRPCRHTHHGLARRGAAAATIIAH